MVTREQLKSAVINKKMPNMASYHSKPSKMTVQLTKKIKSPVILEGFPGMGFVGTVAVEYLLEHLKTESIGYIWSENMPPIATIHNSQLRQLLEVFYCKEKNLVLLHALSDVKGMEWSLAESLINLAKQLKAKETISLEGVGSPFGDSQTRTFYHTNSKVAEAKLKKAGIEPLKEGVIVGVSGALMLKSPKEVKSSFIFAETHTDLPDSKAAAELIKVLDSYLGLKVDYEPLLKKAEQVEGKIKEIMQKAQQAKQVKEKKDISYLG